MMLQWPGAMDLHRTKELPKVRRRASCGHRKRNRKTEPDTFFLGTCNQIGLLCFRIGSLFLKKTTFKKPFHHAEASPLGPHGSVPGSTNVKQGIWTRVHTAVLSPLTNSCSFLLSLLASGGHNISFGTRQRDHRPFRFQVPNNVPIVLLFSPRKRIIYPISFAYERLASKRSACRELKMLPHRHISETFLPLIEPRPIDPAKSVVRRNGMGECMPVYLLRNRFRTYSLFRGPSQYHEVPQSASIRAPAVLFSPQQNRAEIEGPCFVPTIEARCRARIVHAARARRCESITDRGAAFGVAPFGRDD